MTPVIRPPTAHIRGRAQMHRRTMALLAAVVACALCVPVTEADGQTTGVAVGWNPPLDARMACDIVELLVHLSDEQVSLLRTTFEDRLRARLDGLEARLRREAIAWENRWGSRMQEAVDSGRWGEGWMIQAARQESRIEEDSDDVPIRILREVLLNEFSVFLTPDQRAELEIAVREVERAQQSARIGLAVKRTAPSPGAVLRAAAASCPELSDALRNNRLVIHDQLNELHAKAGSVIATALARYRSHGRRGLEFAAAWAACRHARDVEACQRLDHARLERRRQYVLLLWEALDLEEAVVLAICERLPSVEQDRLRRVWNMHRHHALWAAGFLDDAAERRIMAMIGESDRAHGSAGRDEDESSCTHSLQELAGAVEARQQIRATAIQERRRWTRAFEEHSQYFPDEYEAHVASLRELCVRMAEAGRALADAIGSAVACEMLDAPLRAALRAVSESHLPAVPEDPGDAIPDTSWWPGLLDIR